MRGQREQEASATSQVVVAGVIIGIGLAGTLDEIVLHQMLDWHHFLDRAEPDGTVGAVARQVGLLSDGLFHLFSATLLAIGFILLLRAGATALRGSGQRLAGAVLAGAGGFNLYDGVIHHKLLGVHQVRRGVDNLLPYDLAFIGIALVALVAGILLLRRDRRS